MFGTSFIAICTSQLDAGSLKDFDRHAIPVVDGFCCQCWSQLGFQHLPRPRAIVNIVTLLAVARRTFEFLALIHIGDRYGA